MFCETSIDSVGVGLVAKKNATVILKGSVLILYQMPFCGTND